MKLFIRLTTAAAFLLFGAAAQADLVMITFSGSDCSGAYSSDSVCSIVQLEQVTDPKNGQTSWEPATGEDSVSDVIAKNDGAQEVYNGFDADPWNFSWENVTYSDLKDKDGETVTDLFDAVSGTWTYTGDSPIRFWVSKAGSEFTLYFYSDGTADCSAGDPEGNTSACLDSAVSVNSGSWSNESGSAISHLSFYNGERDITVPAPGTLALLGLGLLGMGAARRRKVA